LPDDGRIVYCMFSSTFDNCCQMMVVSFTYFLTVLLTTVPR
jgi:hypothetical protein